jgi:hypothetical protein
MRSCVLTGCLVLAAACSPGDPDPLRPELLSPRPASAEDPVVARVDGKPIYLSRVASVSAELGLPPREVLEGMIEMELLAGEAERRGLVDEQEVRRIWKKALVQSLLEREVESVVDEDSVSMQDVRDYYSAHYRNKGVLLEDAWREIWAQIVADRRQAVYRELVGRLRSRTRVLVDEQNVELYLGEGGG